MCARDLANAIFMRFSQENEPDGVLQPVSEKENQPFHLSFNPCLKVDFQTSRITSDGGLLLMRELDERLGLSPNGPASSRGPCDHGPIQPTRKN